MHRTRFAERFVNVRTRRTAVALLAGLLVAPVAERAAAQLPQTRLYSLSPAGGKAGTTFDVKVTNGDTLDELGSLQFNHPGIKAQPKMQDSGGKKEPVPNTFVVTIDSGVPAGLYEVRTAGLYGLSNPRSFVVGARDEIEEKEPNNDIENAGPITLGQTVNGTINGATDIDVFKFRGKQGQRVIASCRAARIDSRLEAALELYDAAGRRLAFNRNLVRDDPLLDVTLPADGEYYVKLFDFTYGGSIDHFYRLSVHTGPFIDYVLPPAGLAGATGDFTLYGRNLPGGQPAGVSVNGRPLEKLAARITLPQDPSVLQTVENLGPHESDIDGFSYVLNSPAGASNPVFIHFARAPVTLESEPNDEPAKAQKLTVPAEFAGQFQERGDTDYVAFDAKAGEVYFVEVYGERIGTTVDPYFILERVTKNDKGEESVQRIVLQDDDPTNLAPNVFNTYSDDPVYRFQVPADGTYRIAVRDRYFETRGGPRLVYRLAIRPEQPDFRLVVLPETIVNPQPNQPTQTGTIALRKGENIAVRAMAFRRDGFNGTIEVSADGLPNGVSCKGAAIGPNDNSAQLIFSSDEKAPGWSGLVRIIGKARIEDPARARALDAARAAVKPAQDALPKLQQDADKASQTLKQAQDQLAKLKEASSKSPDDQNLKNQVAAGQKQVDAAGENAKKLSEALAAGRKALTDAQEAVKKAEAELTASTKEVAHDGRAATIVWNGDNQRPSHARLARSLGLSVLKDAAPIQITTDAFRFEANQNRQILIPVKLFRRNGFDNNVNLQFDGLPNNSNIQVENKPIPKGKNEELLRIFVNNNAKLGTYTLFLKAQAQVSYRHNPERAERLKAEAAETGKLAAAATEEAKKASQSRDAAAQKANQAAEAVKAATNEKTEAEKKATAAADVVKQATEEKSKADKALADAQAALKTASEKSEAAKKAAAADSGNKALAEAQAAAEKMLAQAQQVAKQAESAQTAAAKKLTEAQAGAKQAADGLAAAQKKLTESEAAAKEAQTARVKAEEAAKQADEKSKSAAEAKKQADQLAQQADNVAKPKNINLFPPSTPIIIEVKQGPANLSASVPSGGNLKRGEKVDVKVTVNRQNGFAGPVTLTLPLPPGVEGLSAAPVTIPADQKEGVLAIQAAGNATEGQLQHMVVRGEMDFEGKAAVDVPITLKVSK